jgi:hypothetical protein
VFASMLAVFDIVIFLIWSMFVVLFVAINDLVFISF